MSDCSKTTLADGTTIEVTVTDGARDDMAAAALSGAVAACAKIADEVATPPVRKIIGNAASMEELFHVLSRIKKSAATVLITGENGTGKEMVARCVHEESPRGGKTFVATNCSAFNDNLLESELFGHQKGSFTGASGDKAGLFSVADKGTFFLDEVGDMTPALQVKLLRVIQEGTFTPVGGTQPKSVDVRIIAATNRNLEQMVKEGTFREDLYYRLHVVAIKVPPLRERREDIPKLTDHFLRRLAERDGKHKAFTLDAIDALKRHHWPGNVRELENEVERIWVLSGDESRLTPELLSPAVTQTTGEKAARPSGFHIRASRLPEAIESLEKEMIREALIRVHGNKTKAAEALNISRRNLIRKVATYGLEDVGRDE